jgi:long-chain fatty acid transport protein
MNRILSLILTLTFCILLPAKAFAIGSGAFENATFSAVSLAQANAVVAQADEPAAISYNPAGITQIPGIRVQGNSAFISSFTFQHNQETGASAKSTGTVNYVPTGYITINPGRLLWNRFSFGVGSDSPFGLSKKYASGSDAAHYTGYNTFLKMYTIKPIAAVKVNDWLSLGGGPIYYRIFDFGGVQAYPNKALGIPTLPDGQVRLNLSGNTWGWQMGALLKPHKKHQLGFYFRSPVSVLTKGLIKVENSTMGGNFETGGNAKINLPLDFTFAYAFKPSDRTTIEADFGFTRWSSFKRLYINADPVNPADDGILANIGKADKDYNNSYSIHVGGNHKINKKLTLLGGMDYVWKVVPNDHFIPSVPDSNRLGVGLGFNYELMKNLDVALTHYSIFYFTRSVSNDISQSLGTSVNGRYFTYLQDIVLSVTLKWDDFFSKTFCNQGQQNPAELAVKSSEGSALK